MLTLSQLGSRLGVAHGGEEITLHGAAPLESATERDLSFVTERRWLSHLGTAGAVLVSPELAQSVNRPHLISPTPAVHWSLAAQWFGLLPLTVEGISPAATIHPTASLAQGVTVAPRAVIGAGVRIGRDTAIHAGAVIHDRCLVGERCIIQSNAVIGSEGFGYEYHDGQHHRIAHLGIVRIEDDVDIGAGTTIDRAKFGETVIGAGTKIDNLVQIAHNVQVGRKVLIVAQVGISGSCTIRDGAVLAGQAGVVPHVTIGAGARVAASTGVATDVPAGKTWSGWWGQDHRRNLSEINAVRKLPEFMKAVREFMKETQERWT